MLVRLQSVTIFPVCMPVLSGLSQLSDCLSCLYVQSLFICSFDPCFQVPGPQCRYAVGSILSEGENKADEGLLKSFETSGFNVFSFPEVTHVVTTSFPHRTFFSVLLGIRRVYPRLEHYIKVLWILFSQSLEFYI